LVSFRLRQPRTVRHLAVALPEDEMAATRRTRTLREREDSLLARAAEVQWRRLQRFERIETPQQAEAYLRLRLAHLSREQMLGLSLDLHFRVIACDLIALGSIDSACVEPHVLMQIALERNARYVILAHNHPSGDCTPSHADIAMTNRLIDLLRGIDVNLLDHLIIGADRSYSFNDAGLLTRN
jgi:DNA repair protein RadC